MSEMSPMTKMLRKTLSDMGIRYVDDSYSDETVTIERTRFRARDGKTYSVVFGVMVINGKALPATSAASHGYVEVKVGDEYPRSMTLRRLLEKLNFYAGCGHWCCLDGCDMARSCSNIIRHGTRRY